MIDAIEVSVWDHRELSRSMCLGRVMIDVAVLFNGDPGDPTKLHWFNLEGAKVVESLADQEVSPQSGTDNCVTKILYNSVTDNTFLCRTQVRWLWQHGLESLH